MAASISGKNALVTGGAKRIGREIALALANAGANVIISYNKSSGEAKKLTREIEARGVRALTIRADLASDDLDGLIDACFDAWGPLDILINNASIFPSNNLDTFTQEDLCRSIRTDAWAPLALSRRFAAKAGSGHIVNVLDTRVAGYDFEHVSYISAKHLLALYTMMMAMNFAPKIAVNAVAPGLILPPEGKDADYLESLKDSLPLKRVGDPAQVAEAVLFLVTSTFITGQVIYVDGGRHLKEAKLG